MFTKTAAGTIVGDNRQLPLLQLHGPPFNRAAFITAPTDEKIYPGIAFFPVKDRKAHLYFLNGNIMQGVGRTDATAAHAEMTGGLLRVDFRSAGGKGIKTGPHPDTIEDADLSTLTALQTAGKELLFGSCSRRPQELFAGTHGFSLTSKHKGTLPSKGRKGNVPKVTGCQQNASFAAARTG